MLDQALVDRLKSLRDVALYRDGEMIVYCPTCSFQYEHDEVGPSRCPDCHGRLDFVANNQAFRDVIASGCAHA